MVHDSNTMRAQVERCLDRIQVAADANEGRARSVRAHASALSASLRAGQGVAQILEAEDAPGIVELLTANMRELETAGAELRATLAVALRAEGLTYQQIGDLFGVSRQRIAALVRQPAARAWTAQGVPGARSGSRRNGATGR